MKNYSIVRIGNEYVVQAGETSILKVASRRRAAKLVSDAADLLQQAPAKSEAGQPVSIGSEIGVIPDPLEGIPDPLGVTPDPRIIPDPPGHT